MRSTSTTSISSLPASTGSSISNTTSPPFRAPQGHDKPSMAALVRSFSTEKRKVGSSILPLTTISIGIGSPVTGANAT